MNPVTDQRPPLPLPLPLPLQPPRSSFCCHRHQDDNFTGFCPSCLCERLNIADQSGAASSSTSTCSSIAAAAVVKSCHQNNPIGSTNVNNCQGEEEIRVSSSSDLEKDILEMEAKIDAIVDNLKSTNDKIHLSKKPSFSNFWSKAANKLQKWRTNNKNNKTNAVVSSHKLPRPHSEVADYGFGRRSCDTAPPRFSLDAGRVSFDIQNPVEEAEASIPGGSTQTREYYFNSSMRRKKGLERSNSIRTTTMTSVVVNNNQNAKVSPASIDYLNHTHRRHSIGGEKELELEVERDDGLVRKRRWWNWKVKKVWGSKNGELSRSNSSVSWRNTGKNKCERDDKNPNSGFLRFYSTPLRGSQRSATGTGTGTGTGTSKSKLSVWQGNGC